MITRERLELNDRFIKCFRALENEKMIQKHQRLHGHSYSYSDVAEALFGNKGYGHVLAKMLDDTDDDRVITYTQCLKFCKIFGISRYYLLLNEGDMFVEKLSKVKTKQPNILELQRIEMNEQFLNTEMERLQKRKKELIN